MNGERLFFDEHQWATVEAAMARVIPTDHQPGAREANTVGFVDRYLSGIGYVWAEPDGSGFQTLSGKLAEAWQQRIDALRKTYIEGVGEMDRRSKELFAEEFHRLPEERQDRILTDMEAAAPVDEEAVEEKNSIAAFEPPDDEPSELGMQQTLTELDLDFFELLAFHTRQGFYSDPIYGGNKNRVGWEVIGFPGPESLAEVHSGRFSALPYFAEKEE